MWSISNLWHTVVGDEGEDPSNNNTQTNDAPPKPPIPSTSSTTTSPSSILPPVPPKLSEWKSWQSPTYAPKLQLSTSEKRSIGKRLVRGVQTWYGNPCHSIVSLTRNHSNVTEILNSCFALELEQVRNVSQETSVRRVRYETKGLRHGDGHTGQRGAIQSGQISTRFRGSSS